MGVAKKKQLIRMGAINIVMILAFTRRIERAIDGSVSERLLVCFITAI